MFEPTKSISISDKQAKERECEILPFDTYTFCPKCGNLDIGETWAKFTVYGELGVFDIKKRMDVIHKHCSCKFAWLEETKDYGDKEKKLSNNTVIEKKRVRDTGDCPLCWGDEASLADLRVIACPVDHSKD